MPSSGYEDVGEGLTFIRQEDEMSTPPHLSVLSGGERRTSELRLTIWPVNWMLLAMCALSASITCFAIIGFVTFLGWVL